MGAKTTNIDFQHEGGTNIMEMILILSLCIITGMLIDRQYSSMRHMERVRAEDNERRYR